MPMGEVITTLNTLIIRRNRYIQLAALLLTIVVGLCSRAYGEYLPRVIALYAGDCLWALMIYFGCGLILNQLGIAPTILLSLLFCYSIEVSQLYHAPWIDGIRANRFGALVLGHGFLWTDIVCYTFGVMAGAIIDLIRCKRGNNR